MDAPDAPRSGARSRVRWGLPDVALAWFAGLLGGVVALAVAIAVLQVPEDEVGDDVSVFLAVVAGQSGVSILVLALVARARGMGGLRRDFGLTVRARDLGWVPAGVALQIVLVLALSPISHLYGRDEAQSVVDLLEDASGPGLVLFCIAVVVLAPLAEELLFRGALLRALLRRTTPAWAVFGSALLFAVVHPLGDPDVGSVIAVPALLALGLVSGRLAVRSGDLSRSILLHSGFNLLTVLSILAD
jgi:membrane protease YdiL (CAAX protease family)